MQLAKCRVWPPPHPGSTGYTAATHPQLGLHAAGAQGPPRAAMRTTRPDLPTRDAHAPRAERTDITQRKHSHSGHQHHIKATNRPLRGLLFQSRSQNQQPASWTSRPRTSTEAFELARTHAVLRRRSPRGVKRHALAAAVPVRARSKRPPWARPLWLRCLRRRRHRRRRPRDCCGGGSRPRWARHPPVRTSASR